MTTYANKVQSPPLCCHGNLPSNNDESAELGWPDGALQLVEEYIILSIHALHGLEDIAEALSAQEDGTIVGS